MYTKIHHIFPGTYSLNNIVRVSKYSPESFCKPHKDAVLRKNGKINKYTLLVYLNTTSGGETVFSDAGKKLKIKPKTRFK